MGCGLERGKSWCLPTLVCLTGITARAMEYFPPRTFIVEPPTGLQDISEDLSDRYSKALRRMKEPSLWKLAQPGETIEAYRLLWLPTWAGWLLSC